MTIAVAQHDDDTRRTGRANAADPHRRCIVTGEVRPKVELIRFVAGPDGTVVPDLDERLPGRGMWLSPRPDVLKAACARNAFAKVAKAPLKVPEDLGEQVERLLVRRCVESLGLARRAGAAAGGFEKVASWLADGRAAVLLQAADAAEDGRRKLRAAAHARDPEVPVIEILDAHELSQAFGERAFAHVAVRAGGLAERIVRDAARLNAFRLGAERADRRGDK